MMQRPRIYAAIGTVLVAAIVIIWMACDTLTVTPRDREWPPRHDSEIMLDDEYAELLDLPMSPDRAQTDPSPAYNETPADNNAEAAPETGMDIVDRGEPAEAPKTVSSERPSPVKTEKKDKKPEKTGPSAAELKKQREQEEARRKATNQTRNAFRNTGRNNADNRGRDEGNAGSPKGSSSVNGHGTGNVGGGWSMPRYNSVPSSVTGSVVMMVKIDRGGRVKSVTFQGGDAPAATDRRVREAVEREVRSRTFTRSDDNAPEESTAYITYRFR